jgi:hypothetical protein
MDIKGHASGGGSNRKRQDRIDFVPNPVKHLSNEDSSAPMSNHESNATS